MTLLKKVFGIVACLLAVLPVWCSSGSTAHAAEAVRIGAVYNLTGSFSSIDGPGFKGMRLAVKLAGERGGVLGRPPVLEPCDVQSDVSLVGPAVQALINRYKNNGLAALGGLNDTDYAMAAAPPAMAAEIPFVSAGATLQDMPAMFGPFFFMAAFGDNAQAQAAAKFAMDSLKGTTCFILTDRTHDFTRALSDYFREAWTGFGGTVSGEDWFESGTGTLEQQIAELTKVEHKTDIIFISAVPADVVRTCSAVRKAGIELPIVSGDGFDTPLLKKLPASAAYSIYYATHVSYLDPSPEVSAFVREWSAMYGSPPVSGFAALGYDTVNLILSAVERAGTTDPEAVRKALAETRDFRGVTGTISYSKGNRVPRKSVDIVGYDNGEYLFADEVMP